MAEPTPPSQEGRTRALTPADLGIEGDVEELRGTFSIVGDRATVRIDMIVARIENPLIVILRLSEFGRAAGAATLRIEGTMANPRLENILIRRYGLRTGGARDYLEIRLR